MRPWRGGEDACNLLIFRKTLKGVVAVVLYLGCTHGGVPGDMLGHLQVASVFEEGRNAGGPERMAGDLRRVEARILRPALDHL